MTIPEKKILGNTKKCAKGLQQLYSFSWQFLFFFFLERVMIVRGSIAEVRLALYSTFTPSSSAVICGLSYCGSQPDLRVFLRVLRFSSLSKIRLSVKNICRLGTVLWDHAWPFDDSLRRLFICIRLALDWVKSISCPVGSYGSEKVKKDNIEWWKLICFDTYILLFFFQFGRKILSS